MKRLQLYKSASDFAFASLAVSDPVNLDIVSAQEFQKQGFEQADYQYWKGCVQSSRAQFLALAQQPAPSAQFKPAAPALPTPPAVPTT
jgi:hypothetical protein